MKDPAVFFDGKITSLVFGALPAWNRCVLADLLFDMAVWRKTLSVVWLVKS